MRQMLDAQPGTEATVVARDKEAVRVSRSLQHRVSFLPVEPSEDYEGAIARAAGRRPGLLVVDELDAVSAPAALEAAASGLRVLSQLDTVFRGAEVVHHLLELGAPSDLLPALNWVVTVQRLETLCPHCKELAPLDPALLAELRYRCPDQADSLEDSIFYRAPGCPHCRHSGRLGEVAAFDLFRGSASAPVLWQQPSLQPLEAYLLGLAQPGSLSPDDVVRSDKDLLQRTYWLLVSAEKLMHESRMTLERRLAELQATNRVLQQRTDALVSLETIGQALIASTSLGELAGRLCRHARDLCGADRAILYFLRPEQSLAEVLAVHGWGASLVGQPLEAALVKTTGTEPVRHDRLPPGVNRDLADVTARGLKAGLRVPLVVQGKQVGLMVVHTSQKSSFAPGEVALLQTFANQAALAIQRTGLVGALREKIEQLEVAQAELVQKERMERELELARQLQQSVLPHTFPLVPGYAFAARSEPARWVGGDFYDVILLEADRIGLIVGDVADKAMPAALYMAQTHSLLRAEARRKASPAAVLDSVHRLLQALSRVEMFVTVFYGIVEGSSRRLTYARAGHDYPLVLRRGLALPLAGEGTALGFPGVENLHLTEEQVDLQPGDRLVLYTDGLVDARASDGRTFGLGRLKATLCSFGHLSADALCAGTFGQLDAFRGEVEPYDDMTLLVMHVT